MKFKFMKSNHEEILEETSYVQKLNYHKLDFNELANEFKTSLQDGLNTKTANMRLISNGENRIHVIRVSRLKKYAKYLFLNGFCGFLWIAALICILAWKIGNPPNTANLTLGLMIILVIFLQALFSAFQDWSSSKVMNSIKKMLPNSALVIRDKTEYKIPVEQLVIGDLVRLSYGNKVPADIRIIESHNLKFDKSMLTGESEDVDGTTEITDESYTESKNIAFMSTLITSGEGKGIVIGTGKNTMLGVIANLTGKSNEKPTLLQQEINKFVFKLGIFALTTAFLVIILWATWLRVQHPKYIDLSDLMVNTIAVIVSFIPEGLPVCITLSLLIIAKRMAKHGVLVKNLSIIETLSSVNVIASDKTGTLTQNKMLVTKVTVGLEILSDFSQSNSTQLKQLLAVASICNNATNSNGNATDIGLLKFSENFLKIENFSKLYSLLGEVPFNSRNKYMLKHVKPLSLDQHKNVFNDQLSSDESLLMLKGAPDILIKKCKTIIDVNGNETELNIIDVNKIIAIQNEWCLMGERVLLLCIKKVKDNECIETTEFLVEKTNDFCLLGLVSLKDPPRKGISDAIIKFRQAGIKVVMLTGDYGLTAVAIASQIGIFTNQLNKHHTLRDIVNNNIPINSSLVLEGKDLDGLSEMNWSTITNCYDEIVFARTTPEQKLKIVQKFQLNKHCVGVTGDGVNDAPALKTANIGIAMGSSSEVALEAAHIVIIDNNFESILIAIEQGRLLFENLRKIILYLLPGGSMAELVPVLFAMFLGIPQNLSSFQMLIICLFTDILPSLSLIMEKPETDLLKKAPRSLVNDRLVDWKLMLQAYIFMGVYISFFSQFFNFYYFYKYANISPNEILFSFENRTSTYDDFYLRGQTVTFVTIVLINIFGNLFANRTHFKSTFTNLSRNYWLILAQGFSLTILLSTVFLSTFNDLFNTRPIPLEFFIFPLVVSIFLVIIEEVRKYLVRKKVFCFHIIAW